MSELQVAIEAARLLGRWTQIAERHGNGCSCCPGLGDVAIESVEGSVVQWLRERHSVLEGRAGIAVFLKDLITRKAQAPDWPSMARDLDEALSHLERIQAGF